MPLPEKPLGFNVFWTSLLLLDPAAALLLVVRPRAGIILTLAIMTADVTINTIAFGGNGLSWSRNAFLYCQVAYALFAFCAAPSVWRCGTRVGARADNLASAA